MLKHYILVGKRAVFARSFTEWAMWLEKSDRRVARDNVGGLEISTVFLGIDHGSGKGDPILFETMVFDLTGQEVAMERYFTWEEAEAGHHRFVEEYEMKSKRAGSIVDSIMRLLRREP